MKGRLLGFDFGLKRIGVATGNLLTGTSQPLAPLAARNGEPVWQDISLLIGEWRPDTLVVGLPLNMDGSESKMSSRARRFGASLEERFELEVKFVDERLTTADADLLLQEATPAGKALDEKRRRWRDGIAAELILRTHMNDNPD